MNFQVIIVRAMILIIGIALVSMDVLLYNSFEQQKKELNSARDKLDVESEFNSHKFKFQEDQIESISKDLKDAQQQIKDQGDVVSQQKDTLAQQKDELTAQKDAQNKIIQTSLVDIKAESDAIKQDMKGWQKDYVTILAQLEKKMEDFQDEMGSIKEGMNSLKTDVEKISLPPDNSLPDTPPAAEKKIERNELQSQ